MSQPSRDEAQHFTIFYEVIAEDVDEADPAEMQAVVNTVVKALRQDGYTVTPVPTGTRGGDLLYQIIPLIEASGQIAMTHQDEISKAIQAITPLVEHISAWHKQRQAGKSGQQAQGGIECELRLGQDYDSLTFKSSDSEGTEQFRSTLERFLESSQHARIQAKSSTPILEGTLTIRERVPSRRRRRRR